MKSAFEIFRRDASRLLRNKAAAIVMVGVCILPSLYAWFNIAANIDPYSNTSGIKVAVANNDSLASSGDLEVNAGEEIIAKLKENDQLGWEFTSEEKAIKGVRSGKYYAAVVIPDDFSSSLISVLSGEISSPQLEYYINEKANAIAPKITSTGAGTIQNEINSTFSSIASEAVSDVLRESAVQLSDAIGTVNSDIRTMLEKTSANIESYEKLLDRFTTGSGKTQELSANAKNAAASLKNAAQSGSAAMSSTGNVLNRTRTAAGALSTTLSNSLSDGENILSQVHGKASEGLDRLDAKAESVSASVGAALDTANSVAELNGQILRELNSLALLLPGSDEVNGSIAKLQAQNQANQEMIQALSAGNNGIAGTIGTISGTRKEISELTSSSLSNLRSLRSSLNQNVLPQLGQTLDLFSSLSGELSGVLAGLPSQADQINGILTELSDALSETKNALNNTGEALGRIDGKLESIRSDLATLESSSLVETLVSLEETDPQAVASFMSSPVEIETTTFYKVANYGSGMTPFYSNLAIWVGGIVLISILKIKVDKDGLSGQPGNAACYFGRLLLFLVPGLIQGLIVCAGDILLPGVKCVHKPQLILTGIVCSLVYVCIIYSLASTFRHIGKALCVLLVILQIPGSSGTYPIEMTPAFFQHLHPLLPFTYGVAAMRECIAGMYGAVWAKNILILLCYIPISLLVGLGLNPLLSELNRLFDRELYQSGLFLSEIPEQKYSRKTQLSMLLQASLSHKGLQLETARKAERFEKNYRKYIRLGFLGILIIPVIFLVLMFSLESKIVFLILWIVSVVLIAGGLITVEYIHNQLAEEKELAGKTFDEMLEAFRGKDERK